jgi:hypothetical protein
MKLVIDGEEWDGKAVNSDHTGFTFSNIEVEN